MAAYAAFMTNVACGLSTSDISSRPLKSSAATGGVCMIRSGVDAEVCNRRTERRPRLNVTSKSRRRPTDKSRELQQHQQQQRQQVLVGRHAACQPCAAAFHLDNWSLLMSCAGAPRRIVWRGEATRRRAGPDGASIDSHSSTVQDFMAGAWCGGAMVPRETRLKRLQTKRPHDKTAHEKLKTSLFTSDSCCYNKSMFSYLHQPTT